jgi:hypothetical protein
VWFVAWVLFVSVYRTGMTDTCIPLLELKRPIKKEELAAWGGWTPRYIDMEIAKGRLVKTMSGKAVRLMAEDIRDWIQRRKSSEVSK